MLGITATPERSSERSEIEENKKRNMADEIALKMGYTKEEIEDGKHIASEMTLEDAIRLGIVANPKVVSCEYLLDEDGSMTNLLDRINNIKNEKELQKTLIQNISKFILELGNGFSFVSEKYKLKVDEDFYEIDLLFYHIPSHSYVVIELKTTKFKPEYIGQLLFYTNYIDAYVKSNNDSNTIGIVLCPEANGFVCKTTLMNTKNIAISKYKFMYEIPEYLERRLREIK